MLWFATRDSNPVRGLSIMSNASCDSPTPVGPFSAWRSLWELYVTRLREFFREPARIFWVYGFPTILAICLGMAFRSSTTETFIVDLVAPSASETESTSTQRAAFETLVEAIQARNNDPQRRPDLPILQFKVVDAPLGWERLITGKTALLARLEGEDGMVYHYDPTRAEARAARAALDDLVQRARGRLDPVRVENQLIQEPGSRYIDWLIPGLIGLNTMGGGMWGIGFLLVNFRRNGLLKRFRATPMPRWHFLSAILGARLTFLIPDVAVLLTVGVVVFGMPIRGSLATAFVVVLAGATAFAGIGLLIASRVSSTEAVNGMMNLVMLPMWMFSGIFFSYERFPEVIHPFIQALPMTQMLDALRAVLLEGAGWAVIWPSVAILMAWGVIPFVVAVRIFKWT
ncbi:ABC-2 type transporter [Isosphaera pallida ATCC 43644]|uniref:ABC-2 type transporter n=2 Tax=Isosphaera pallida TaxID=128 RepID=E8R2X8_ISOPI|nr:ABC-2 type transporter [Isosphaera pallida ATCC 43644]